MVRTDFVGRRLVLGETQSVGLGLLFGPGPLLLGQGMNSAPTRAQFSFQDLGSSILLGVVADL